MNGFSAVGHMGLKMNANVASDVLMSLELLSALPFSAGLISSAFVINSYIL